MNYKREEILAMLRTIKEICEYYRDGDEPCTFCPFGDRTENCYFTLHTGPFLWRIAEDEIDWKAFY